MNWARWFHRQETVPVPSLTETPQVKVVNLPVERPGIRDVGHCEVCGRSMKARTRREEFRGRVDCDCGARNHVEFREVRTKTSIEPRHVSVTAGKRIESATHRPNLRLEWRYGVCPTCASAVRLLDAFVVAHEDAAGTSETVSYYCLDCHTHDDGRHGRLVGHDGSPVVDSTRFLIPPR